MAEAPTSLHVIERAVTGRAKCRGCDQKVAAGESRFGERVPNPYADDGGQTTHWFHVACAAFSRPEAFLEALPAAPADLMPDRERLEREATLGAAHRRLPRARGAERAATGRAACRQCREPIEKGAWRIALVYYEDGRFTPSGYIHITCAAAYLETTAIIGRLRHFSPTLTDADVDELRRALET